MEKYSKAVSETYSRFKKESHPLEKCAGRSVNFHGKSLEVVGYKSRNELEDAPLLIVDASQIGGWSVLGPSDVILKECESYWYVSVGDLID